MKSKNFQRANTFHIPHNFPAHFSIALHFQHFKMNFSLSISRCTKAAAAAIAAAAAAIAGAAAVEVAMKRVFALRILHLGTRRLFPRRLNAEWCYCLAASPHQPRILLLWFSPGTFLGPWECDVDDDLYFFVGLAATFVIP